MFGDLATVLASGLFARDDLVGSIFQGVPYN